MTAPAFRTAMATPTRQPPSLLAAKAMSRHAISLLAIATTQVECLKRTAPVERAVEIMRHRNVKHVVLTDNQQRVVGIVSIKDMLRQIILPASMTAAESK